MQSNFYTNNNFIIAWQDGRSGDWDCYGQIFDPNGTRI